MKHDMITSASGWRKVFTISKDENDDSGEIGPENMAIVALAAETFADYILSKKKCPLVVLGNDTRPTGPQIANTMIKVLLAKKIAVTYAGIIAAPEIMAYSQTVDAFIYITASHNPIGHNGIKFGLNDGGVLNGTENAKLVKEFEKKCAKSDAIDYSKKLANNCSDIDLDWVYAESIAIKRDALGAYRQFSKQVISGTTNITQQNFLFSKIRKNLLEQPLGIVCDMNGSARTLSIDSTFLNECGFSFYGINNIPGQIVHEIIPEGENLNYCAKEIENRQNLGDKKVVLGYMPDCDGDRGNIVYWDEKEKKAKILKAQDVFALSVLSELTYQIYSDESNENKGLVKKAEQFIQAQNGVESKWDENLTNKKFAVVVNGPTSMRIDEIANTLKAKVFRAEVGEANVVNLARIKRTEGYEVRILGEGSNGGNITHPSAVRDPINTIFAIIKLLVLKDERISGITKKGLFHIWCEASNQMDKYKELFTLRDVIETLPKYTTTGVSENRAILKIKTEDHSVLKSKFQKIFTEQWELHKDELKKLYNFSSYEAVRTNGTEEIKGITDYSESAKGGLKIIFKDENKTPLAYIWMRGSGTEPVFRIMCDIKGDKEKEEKKLLEWETQMLRKADE